MRRPARHGLGEAFESGPLTPMIDVVFLLLVFFVCASATQVREAVLPADLPAGSLASPDTPTDPPPLGEVWVKLRAEEGRTIAELNGTAYGNLDELAAQLRKLAELAPEIPVILDVSDDVPFGELIRIYDVCRQSKFQQVSFAVDAGKKAAGP